MKPFKGLSLITAIKKKCHWFLISPSGCDSPSPVSVVFVDALLCSLYNSLHPTQQTTQMKCILQNGKATNVKGANCTAHKSVIFLLYISIS